MQCYLVSPTYLVTGSHVEYCVGYIRPTRGRSVKFINLSNTNFVRYAKTSEDIRDANLSYVGLDNCGQAKYILVSGESWRYLVDNCSEDALELFEYFENDKLLKIPIIRIKCELDQIKGDKNGQYAFYVKLPLYTGELRMKIVNHTIQDVEVETTVGSFNFPKPEKYWVPPDPERSDKCGSAVKVKVTGAQGASNRAKIDDTAEMFAVPNLQDYIKHLKQQKPKKENKNMNLGTNLFKDLSFGKASCDFALSFDNHITFRGKYYDNGALNDACGLTLDLDGLLYVMPTQELKAGDIIYKKGVDAYYYDGTSYISLTTGQKAEYVPTKVLGMTFYSVIKNLAGNMFGAAASKDNPMANMLPFLLLDRDSDNDDLLKFMLLSQGNFNFLQPQSTAKPESK